MDTEETKDDVETTESDDTSVNWEAKFTKLKERQRSAKTAYESRIAELEGKIKEPIKETKELKSEYGLLEDTFMIASGYAAEDEKELLRKWQKDTNKPIQEIVKHPFVITEIASLRTAKANQLATQNIKSDSQNNAKDDIEHYLATDTRPEDKMLRRKVVSEKLKRTKDGTLGGKFYNDK